MHNADSLLDDQIKANADAISAEVSRAQQAEADIADDVSKLVTLSGMAVDSEHFGQFTGGIITDNQTLKDILQELESAIASQDMPVYIKPNLTSLSNRENLEEILLGNVSAVDEFDSGQGGVPVLVSVADGNGNMVSKVDDGSNGGFDFGSDVQFYINGLLVAYMDTASRELVCLAEEYIEPSDMLMIKHRG